MPPLSHVLSICFATSLVSIASAQEQKEIANPQAIASAKTAYFEDKSGVDAVGKKAVAELSKWGRFQIVQDPKKADLIILLSTDPGQGGNLVVSGGQTATIDSQGHVEEDRVPTFNKLEPTRQAFLIVTDTRSGTNLWSSSQRWGGLLTGFDNVGEHLVQEFEKQTRLAEQRAHLKAVKSVNPNYPPEASRSHVEGAVTVRIVVDKKGMVTSAKAVSGPTELFQASIEAAKQWQFEPPEGAPITTKLEMKYNLEPKPCPTGEKGRHPAVYYAERLPLKANHPGALKVVGDINVPLPPYPEKASDAGIEGTLELFITVASSGDVIGARVTKSLNAAVDDAAVTTVRTWKFKVSRGVQTGFPIKFVYKMECFSSDEK